MFRFERISDFLSKEISVLSRVEKVFFVAGTGLFIFLFLLFFQPFGVNNYDPRETISFQFFWLMFSMGLFVSVVLAINEFLLFPLLIKKYSRKGMILWSLWSVFWLGSWIFLFYNYLGGWHDLQWKSFFGFIGNIGMMSILPIAVILFYIRIRELGISLKSAHSFSYGSAIGDQLLIFTADNLKDQFSVPLKYLLYLESEDNYIAVYHLHDGSPKKTLIRKSLKQVQEENLDPALIRCHRSLIINQFHLQQIKGNRNKLVLSLDHVKDPIPVSRQYIDDIYLLISD